MPTAVPALSPDSRPETDETRENEEPPPGPMTPRAQRVRQGRVPVQGGALALQAGLPREGAEKEECPRPQEPQEGKSPGWGVGMGGTLKVWPGTEKGGPHRRHSMTKGARAGVRVWAQHGGSARGRWRGAEAEEVGAREVSRAGQRQSERGSARSPWRPRGEGWGWEDQTVHQSSAPASDPDGSSGPASAWSPRTESRQPERPGPGRGLCVWLRCRQTSHCHYYRDVEVTTDPLGLVGGTAKAEGTGPHGH